MLAGRGEHVRATDDANAVARQEGVCHFNHYNLACVFAVSSSAAENDSKLAPADRARLKAQYADRGMESFERRSLKVIKTPLCSGAIRS